MTDALGNLKFKSEGGDGLFIRFKADEPVKLKVFSTNPIVANDQFGNTRYSFAVWNFAESKPMILSAGATITRGISELHMDDDYGQDITKLDIKISPTGEKMERRYSIQVLPKSTPLTDQQTKEVEELDRDLGKYIKNGLRAEEYNEGKELPDSIAPMPADDTPSPTLEDMPEDFLT